MYSFGKTACNKFQSDKFSCKFYIPHSIGILATNESVLISFSCV